MLFFACTLVVIDACDSDKNEAVFDKNQTAVYKAEEVAEQAFGVVESITNAAMRYSDATPSARLAEQNPELGCAELKFLGNGTSGELTIDFGEGCVGTDGKTRKGIVVVEYDGNWAVPNTEVYTVLKDFYVDEVRVEGARKLTNVSLDVNSLVFIEEIINGKVTWPDNTYLSRTSDMVHSVTPGNNDGSFEMQIEGNATGRSRYGVNYRTEIVEPLLVKSTCRLNNIYLPVSGTKTISIPEKPTITVNYGIGECDSRFTVTIEDASKEVVL